MKKNKSLIFFFLLSLLWSCSENQEQDESSAILEENYEKVENYISENKTNSSFLKKLYLTEPSCEEANTKLRDYYLERIEEDYLWRKIWLNSSQDYTDKVAVDDTAEDASANTEGPTDYTKTNTQVSGVDEPDMMKTDGVYTYHVEGKSLFITKIWPADELTLQSKLDLGSYANNLFFDEEKQKLFIFSEYYENFQESTKDSSDPDIETEASSEDSLELSDSLFYPGSSYTLLITVDIENKQDPQISKKQFFPGYYRDARKIDDQIFFFLSEYDMYPTGISWDYNYDDSLSEKKKSLEESYEKNKKFISTQNYDDLILRSYEEEGEKKNYQDIDCTEIHFPEVSQEYGRTRIVSLNTSTESYDESILMSASSQIYASLESLYLLGNHYRSYLTEEDALSVSYIHRFTLSDNVTKYVGSGIVDGYLLNQFSADEYNGHFRIATTVQYKSTSTSTTEPDTPVTSDEIFSQNTVNRVTILKLEEDYLKIVGETEDLAEGERIYSARFMGEKGYVVTFRQVDPLFTLDLSDPENPKVLGELKIPGFSSYIHPISESHLLTIGRDVDEETGRQGGIKLSLFDVSDMENPVEASVYLEDSDSWSEASWDHHAFTYYPKKRMLAIPLESYSSNRYQAILSLYEVSEDFEIKKIKELNFPNLSESYASVRRSLFSKDSDENFYLYALLNNALFSYQLEDLESSLDFIRF